jgi:hypothetical protein
MQSLRDAAILLAILLLVATVRVVPKRGGATGPEARPAGGVEAAEPAPVLAPALPPLEMSPAVESGSLEAGSGAICIVPGERPLLDERLGAGSRVLVYRLAPVELHVAPMSGRV